MQQNVGWNRTYPSPDITPQGILTTKTISERCHGQVFRLRGPGPSPHPIVAITQHSFLSSGWTDETPASVSQSVTQSVSTCISFQPLTLNCVTIQSESILFNYITVFFLFSYSNLFLNTLILASAESPMPSLYCIQAFGLIPE